MSGLTATPAYQTTTNYGITCVNNGYQTYLADSTTTSIKSYAHAQYTPSTSVELPVYNENGNFVSFALESTSGSGFWFSDDGKYLFYRGFQYLTKTPYGLDLVEVVSYNLNFNYINDYDGYYGNGQPYLYKKNNYIGFFSEDSNEFMRIK